MLIIEGGKYNINLQTPANTLNKAEKRKQIKENKKLFWAYPCTRGIIFFSFENSYY